MHVILNKYIASFFFLHMDDALLKDDGVGWVAAMLMVAAAAATVHDFALPKFFSLPSFLFSDFSRVIH